MDLIIFDKEGVRWEQWVSKMEGCRTFLQFPTEPIGFSNVLVFTV
jgi:hypothetical protein